MIRSVAKLSVPIFTAWALAAHAGAQPADDDAVGSDELGVVYEVPDQAVPSVGDAMQRWQAQRPWRYGTQYFFPLTRGLEEAGVPARARPAAWVFTVPFDVAHLPFAAIAGLFGS